MAALQELGFRDVTGKVVPDGQPVRAALRVRLEVAPLRALDLSLEGAVQLDHHRAAQDGIGQSVAHAGESGGAVRRHLRRPPPVLYRHQDWTAAASPVSAVEDSEQVGGALAPSVEQVVHFIEQQRSRASRDRSGEQGRSRVGAEQRRGAPSFEVVEEGCLAALGWPRW